MPNATFVNCLRVATAADLALRSEISRKWHQLEENGVCPTCREIQTGEATANEQGELILDDEHSFSVLERFPRALGHTIVISKGHFAAIAELPEALGCHVMKVMLRLTRALKQATGCDKVYQVTMCSGALSHLHFQLLPRLPGERIGGGVFSAPRMALADARPLTAAIKQALARQFAANKRDPSDTSLFQRPHNHRFSRGS